MTIPSNTYRTFSRKLRPPVQKINTTNTLPAGVLPNPFGNTVQFTEVDSYLDQLNQMPAPTIIIPNRFPSVNEVAGYGITIEIWFNALSSGSLVNLPVGTDPANPTAIAPLIYIDSNGLLRGGLFDLTQITDVDNNLIYPLNSLSTPLSVVDGQWHHVALVVQPPSAPGGNGIQSLLFDGRLVGAGTANGTLNLSFVASGGATWTATTNANVPLGGAITPQPLGSGFGSFLPYAQGFSGCLTEQRIWNGPRATSDIQALMNIPLSTDLGTYESMGLVGYVGASQLQQHVQPTAYLSLVPDAPPWDPFTDVTNRVPGYQNYGVFMAIPFTSVAPQIVFPDPSSQPYSTKISLAQADQLEISFPTDDANQDTLTGTFSMTLTGASSGQLLTTNPIKPGQVLSFTVPATDCYRLDFTYSTAVTVSNLQFMVVPGPANTIAQLLLTLGSFQTAYSDPNYPTTATTIPDPRKPNATVTRQPYWPPFTDQTVFPTNPNSFGSTELLEAYLYLNEAATSIAQTQKLPTFNNFFNLNVDNAGTYVVSGISSLLDLAYKRVTGNNPPDPTITSFNSAYDQVYVFIYNANLMRGNLNEFLTKYNGWATAAIGQLALTNIPQGIATTIYDDQLKTTLNLNGPSKGDFIASLIVESVIWGLGAVFPMIGPVEAIMGPIVGGFIGSAGANALSELFGASLGSTSAQVALKDISYTTLDNFVTNVVNDLGGVYKAIIGNLLDPQYLQTLYSNYGLLQALTYASAQPLWITENNILAPGSDNSLTTGATYASWKMLIPAVFTWYPQQLGNNAIITGLDTLYMPPFGPSQWLYQGGDIPPSSLAISQVLSNDTAMLYSMMQQVQELQTGSTPTSAQLFGVCPISLYVTWPQEYEGAFTGAWIIVWALADGNQNNMSSDLVSTLFGIGGTNVVVSPVDQNNPLAAAGYGWYCQIANAGLITPFEAFMEWGQGVPHYSPQILLPKQEEMIQVQWEIDELPAVGFFYTTAAGDIPPSAGVTLEPSVLNFGTTPIGSIGQSLGATLKNNQPGTLQNIQLTQSGSTAFKLGFGVPSELQPNTVSVITATFEPAAGDLGAQTGKLTITATAPYGPITLTVELSGTGVEPS